MKSSFSLVLILIAISGVSYLTIFKNLGDPQIRMWDEATYANNSIDFFENHNFISVTHLGATDWYNTKPPFVIWTQGIAMKIFGINEFAVRIPSALFGLLTALLVFTFCWQVLKSKLIGFFAAIILL